ncbi:MAG: 16S rRNA (cytidine(1402)-2'-O)-methyltransferase [Bacteriovoracaceae bacterium]
MSRLVLVGLPIGNLKDISKRALEALKNSKVIICEDSKNVKKLMSLLEISLQGKFLETFHDHSSEGKFRKIENYLKSESEVVLVSDAGSPIISDPGYPIVQLARSLGIEVETLPGPTSVVAALELSGLPPIPFTFGGFLGRNTSSIRSAFSEALKNEGTHIFFESPHRIKKTLNVLAEEVSSLEDAHVSAVVCREITKLYQEVISIDLSSYDQTTQKDFVGECVLVFHVGLGQKQEKLEMSKAQELAHEVLKKPGHKKTLAKLLAYCTSQKTQDVFKSL